MRKFFIVISYSVYLVIFLGFALHTSSHPSIIGKYTLPYLIFLLVLIFFFPFFLFLLIFIAKTTVVVRKKRKYIIEPFKKCFLGFLLFIVILTPIESYFQIKYRNVEQEDYRYTLQNFHPFLQLQFPKQEPLHINSYGFRGDEITKQKPKNTYRIFVLGGSTALSAGVPFEKSAVRLLEKKLQKEFPDRKIQIMNAGMDGYTSEHSLIQYLFLIKDFHPDLIIMWHGINDWYYSCSPNVLSGGSYKSDYSHFYGAVGRMATDYFKPSDVIHVHLITFDVLMKFFQDNWYSDVRNYILKKNPYPGIYSPLFKNQIYEKNDFPSIVSYRRNLLSLINETKSDGVTLILGDQPTLYKDHMKDKEAKMIFFPKLHCSARGKYPNLHSVVRSMTLFNNTTRDVADQNGISFVDLEKQMPKTAEYFTDDVHYTEEGNKKMADILYTYLKKNGLVHK